MANLQKYMPTDHEDWLKARRNGIGGSDAAAIIGCNDFSSPYEVWLDKMGMLDPKEPNEAMRQGTELEGYVAWRFSDKTGKKVRRRPGIFMNPDYPFALATIDRWVLGENAGLECKTTNAMNLSKFRDGEFPANYYVQCMHYMAVTGADKWYLAVLVQGKDFLTFEFERDEEMIADLMEAERDLWDHVVSGIPPETDGTDATGHALSSQYPGGAEGDIDLFGVDFDRLNSLKEQKKSLEREIKRIEQEAKARMGDFETGHNGKWKVYWKTQTRKSFDHKRFEESHPELDLSPYFKESVSRVFRVKEA